MLWRRSVSDTALRLFRYSTKTFGQYRPPTHCRCPYQSPDRRLAPVLRRDLHEEAVGILEIDRRAVGIGLIRISRFGVRQLAIDFVSEAFGSDPIHMVDCHCEMCDHALLSGH